MVWGEQVITRFMLCAPTYMLDGALMVELVGKSEADCWLMDHTPLYYMPLGASNLRWTFVCPARTRGPLTDFA